MKKLIVRKVEALQTSAVVVATPACAVASA
jgi:hypothetical protein